jgi:hypothetical protein
MKFNFSHVFFRISSEEFGRKFGSGPKEGEISNSIEVLYYFVYSTLYFYTYVWLRAK